MRILYKAGKLVVGALLLLSSPVYAQGLHPISNTKYNPDGSLTLPGHVPREVSLSGLATKISQASSNQILDLRVILPSKNQSGLDSFLKDLYNPKSPNYHKFLTHKQVVQQFGADPIDSSLVVEQLKSNGLSVKGQSDDGRILLVTGPVSAAQKMFKLNINNYKKKSDGTMFFAPDSNPSIPTQIAGKISWITGMDNVRKYHPHFHLKKISGSVKNQAAKSALNSPVPKAISPAFSGPSGTVAPSDILTAYNLNSVPSDGTGQTQALFELDGFVPGDITEFTGSSGFNISPVPPITVVPVDGGVTTPGEGISEVDLDIDLTMAVAPGLSSIRVYEAPNTAQAWIDEWNQIFTDDTAQIVSCSWGGPENGPDTAHTTFQEMAVQGQTIFASAGDAGAYDNCQSGYLPGQTNSTPAQYCTTNYGSSYCVSDDTTTPVSCVQGTVSVDDPASDPYITSTGISLLTVNGNETYNSETSSLYGGGGISGTWPISDSSSNPAYSYQGTLASQAPQPASMVSTTMRNVPDVVFTADPATSYPIYISDPQQGAGWYAVWGSSATAPVWAAFISRVNQGRAAGSESVLGFLNPILYQIYAQNQSSCSGTPSTCDFHDISTGTNDYYPAETGLDDATGLGSFNGLNLYNDLIAGVPYPPTTVTAVPGDFAATVSFSGALANGSPITGYTVNANSGGYSATGSSSPITVTGLTNGTAYTFTVTAASIFGAGAASNPSNSVISGTPLAPTSVSASVAGVSQQATVSFTPPSNNGYAITGYTATSFPGGITGTCAGAACSPITVPSLVNGTSYTFSVTAANSNGTGPASAASNSVIPYGPPLPPTTVTAVGGNTQATVTFSGASANGSPITLYTVTPSPATNPTTFTGASSPILVTGLTNGTLYTFTVTASNTDGPGAASSPSNSVTPGSQPGPTSLKAAILAARIGSHIVEGGVSLTWVQSTASGITQNKIYRSQGSGAYSLLATISATTSYKDTNMTKGISYSYNVTAYTSSGAETLSSNPVAVNY